ncbi:helix-turn-helix domain protein [Actinobacillus succinogenes 130Z]|uniref:Helix-turn-helix domain protein n=2 Tax=Actinobacillus succinogenes TaxID=67854 RepID=A6VNX7_ACTSZ|nr:helix-turn-helix domain-containing protein [Actinobacillus succinogenes]ABR74674.1 helix-turn-helix domain protein [Actinobacillus succinogenes 130Z]
MFPMVVTTPQMLAHAIKEYRNLQKKSQTEVAKFANTKQATISVFENDPNGTKIETLFNILTALELELVVQPRPKSSEIQYDDEGEVW